MDLDHLEHDYQKALRAWHVAWQARVDWHREHFYPLEDREQSVVYEEGRAGRSSGTLRNAPTIASLPRGR